MKIPPQAQKVFTGVIFDVYQWEEKMFDGSSATFEMLKRPDTVLIIPTIGEMICITQEEQPVKGSFTSLLGGRVEENEQMLDAAKRELREESGMESDDWMLFKTYHPYTKIDWTIYVYIARNCQTVTQQKLDPGEKISLKKVSFSDFLEYVTNGSIKEPQLTIDILRMKYTPSELEQFQKTLFTPSE